MFDKEIIKKKGYRIREEPGVADDAANHLEWVDVGFERLARARQAT